ncbi:hypothetical protein GW221_09220 [Escherichia coli]|uniref:hypothetical protein n=1 Tax=Atlantibacter hermannii TaxID=565 RepID=UPI001D30BB0A|nr:hypothetical protein [Atlantibacter hermannii]EGZ6657225.1 hypothetical protein [Escherichia coli]
MLEGYFDLDGVNGPQVAENRKRLLAVQAALEIAKASVSANTADSNNSKARWDLTHIAAGIEDLADAIQASLEAK